MSPEQHAGQARHAEAEAQLREAVEASEVLQGQLQGVQEQAQMLQAIRAEYEQGSEALDALRNAKAGDEVLLPLGGGNFVRATLAEQDRVISGIGSGYSLEGNIEEAQRRVQEQVQAAEQALQRLEAEGQRIVGQMQAVEAHLRQLTGQE